MTVIVSSRARKQTGSSKAMVLQEAKYPLECNRKSTPIKSPKDTSSAQAKAYDPDGLHPMSSSVCAAVPATVHTAVPATFPTAVSTAVPANVPAAVPATAPTAIPATVPTAVPATVPTDVPSCNADYGCWDHIFQVLSLLEIQANSDMSANEPGIKEKFYSLPSGPHDDKDGADAEGSGALDDHTMVTKNIVQAIKQEKSFHIEGIAGRAKVSADAVVVRLTEEYLAGNIRLAELPVVGQVRTSYQSIGQSKYEASKSPRKKTGCDKPQRKKQKTSNTTFDWSKPLLKWSKPQLQTYLARHNLETSQN
ncbi:hypothetical protein EMCRGX_G004191 [Ephydatia muelleri]